MTMTFKELKAKYPRLIPQRFGFECHEGWIPILDAYFAVVDRFLPPGVPYNLRQVKEKLGGLRIYDHSDATASSPEISDAHMLAEARSVHTCEYCGAPGVYSDRRGYLTTVCKDHAELHGEYAEPCAGEFEYYLNSKRYRYDPDVDAFVEIEEKT
ncbi:MULTISPECIES: hypothetical protein [unclassified Rhizobium]|uniref:hypothetical protein n=1 Tax=unclassified Rhizobium TaxID=2613769 RepID=UPI0007F053B3|nr:MULTISPECIES: hypothetical protein [unclassified Rhizobium]ANM09254.1 hypothetical protein AMK05_CH00825 [Rhizobium sp. N324]OYD02822.1 hypothetical protein AMK08_CH100821 [Rhizobium sp. N4311]